jgi:hypothetical protein
VRTLEARIHEEIEIDYEVLRRCYAGVSMKLDWLPKALVPFAIFFVLGVFRKLAPAPIRSTSYKERQVPDPLPTGIIGTFMWGVGICLALSLFLLKTANHLWAEADGVAILRLFPTSAIWFFLPGFAAIAIPWPLTVWLLRRNGRTDEADSIEVASDARGGGVNSFKVMKWLCIGVVGPIAFFTMLAIPMHLSIAESEVRVGHYASLKTEVFPLSQAKRATLVDGYRLRDGSFQQKRDLYIDFIDGRRLDVNAAGDGGSQIDDTTVELLLAKTGLQASHVSTVEDLPQI